MTARKPRRGCAQPDHGYDKPPPTLLDLTRGYAWRRRTAGLSGARVFQLTAPNRPVLFLKVERAGPFSEAEAEAERLPWLAAQGVACPALLAAECRRGRIWLLSAGLPGRDLATNRSLGPAATVDIIADALRGLHGRPIEACPFDQRLAVRLARARAHVAAGDLDDDEFKEEGGATRALEALIAAAPAEEDLVVTHGDATLSNVMAADGGFTGFIDCGRVGVADRCVDLALACDSVAERFGPGWGGRLLERYGLAYAEPARLAFYERLDAFF